MVVPHPILGGSTSRTALINLSIVITRSNSVGNPTTEKEIEVGDDDGIFVACPQATSSGFFYMMIFFHARDDGVYVLGGQVGDAGVAASRFRSRTCVVTPQ